MERLTDIAKGSASGGAFLLFKFQFGGESPLAMRA